MYSCRWAEHIFLWCSYFLPSFFSVRVKYNLFINIPPYLSLRQNLGAFKGAHSEHQSVGMKHTETFLQYLDCTRKYLDREHLSILPPSNLSLLHAFSLFSLSLRFFFSFYASLPSFSVLRTLSFSFFS